MVRAIGHSWLVVAHTIGVLVAAIAAVFAIRSIVWSGPILAFSGAGLAVLSYRKSRPIGFGFGLTATAAALVWFLIIFSLNWSPDTAQLPVSLFFVVFALASIPGGVFCCVEAAREKAGTETRFQFGIGTLLSIMFFVAAYLGILRMFDVFGRLFSFWSHRSP